MLNDLGCDLPTGVSEQAEDGISQVGVRRVEQPIKRLAMPEDPNAQRCAECACDPDERPQRGAVSMPTLETRDRGSR